MSSESWFESMPFDAKKIQPLGCESAELDTAFYLDIGNEDLPDLNILESGNRCLPKKVDPNSKPPKPWVDKSKKKSETHISLILDAKMNVVDAAYALNQYYRKINSGVCHKSKFLQKRKLDELSSAYHNACFWHSLVTRG